MPTLDDLSQRVDQLENKQGSRIGFFFQFILSPVLVVVIGGFLTLYMNLRVEQAKQAFQTLELEVKRIETSQHMLGEVFSSEPARAFIADRLMTKLMDKQLAEEFSLITSRYFLQKFHRKLSLDTLYKNDDITTAANSVGGTAAKSFETQLQKQRYYIVALSLEPSQETEAIDKAKTLKSKGYDSEVHRSNHSERGHLAVTLGHLPFAEAKLLLTEAVRKGDGPKDSYLIPGKTFTEKIYPK